MRRSIPLLATLLSVLALVLSAVPAAALSPFGGVVEVYEPDCRPATFVTDAAMGTDGVLRGFVSAPLGGCQENPVIRYFEKDGSSVTGVSTPYRGWVVAVASDTTGVYLLYMAASGRLWLAKRAGGSFTHGRRLSKRVNGQGDLIASGGSWWAVWTEPEPTLKTGGTVLVQAKTMGADVLYQRLTPAKGAGDEEDPALALRPGNRAVLAWSRSPLKANWTALWVASAERDGKWRSRQFELAPAGKGARNRFPSVAVTGPATYISWERNGSIMIAGNGGGAWKRRSFITPGVLPQVAASGGKVFVGFTTIATSSARAFITQRTGSTWSGNFLSPSTPHDQVAIGTFSHAGKATVLMFSPTRLYARSQGS